MKISMVVGLLALNCAGGWAADALTPMNVKPGLWEASMAMTGGPAIPANLPAIPPEALAQMSPQQREQIQSMLKGRGGAPAVTTKFCMTPDQLKQNQPVAPVDSGCSYKVVNSSTSRQQIHLDCKKGSETRTGDVTVERLDSEHMNVTTSLQTAAGEKPMAMKTSLKWLAAACGDVKPAGAR
jgi:hypothetical protein